MTDQFPAMCAELADALAEWQLGGGPPEDTADADLIVRARTLLAETEAEGPTDEEIEEWADACPEAPLEEMDPEVHGWRRCFTAKEFSETIRAALARWGRPAAARLRNCPTHGQQPPEAWGCPDCVRELREELAASPHPTPAVEGEVEELVADLNEIAQILCGMEKHRWAAKLTSAATLLQQQAAPVPEPGEVPRIGHILRLAEIIREVDGKHDKGAAALAEAILSHPGIGSTGLTAALAQPVAEGPTDEDLVEALRRLLMWPPRSTEAACEQDYTFARAVLARWGRPAAAPVPVSERLPKPEDCDEQGRCWLWERDCGYSGCKWALVDRTWSLSQSDEDLSVYTHWLPSSALPLPAPEGGESQP